MVPSARQVLEKAHNLDRGALTRHDPAPRIEVLAETRVVGAEHPIVTVLQRTFKKKAWEQSA